MQKSALIRLLAASSILGAGLGVGHAIAQTDPANSVKANEVIARTHATRSTFAVYNWHRIWLRGQPPAEEWTAEFHSGPLDRVETPRDRVVANCETMSGSALLLQTGEITSAAWVAGEACGIDRNRPLISAIWLGLVDTPCGKADRIRLTDDVFIRTYDVSPDGMIIETSYLQNTPERSPVLVDLAVTCQSTLPREHMFDEASLGTTYVPELLKQAPANPKVGSIGAP